MATSRWHQEAAFIINPTTHLINVSFAGVVLDGNLVNPVSAGYNLISSMVPQAGRITSDLGCSPNDGDQLSLWNPTIQYNNPPLSATTFSFITTGVPGSHWNVYASTDLNSWQSIGEATLDGGSALFTDIQVSGVAHRFYRVSDGNCCSPAIGFTRVSAVPGSTLIANQLDAADNTINGLFGPTMANGLSLPDGTVIQKWNGSQFVNYTWNASGVFWSPNGDATLAPGGGAMIQNPGNQSFEVAFAGLVREGHLVNPTTAGYNLISSMIPQAGGITSDLGFNPNDSDQLMIWDEAAQGYDQSLTYFAGYGWFDSSFNPAEPSLMVGKGAFLYSGSANSWIRDFFLACPISPANP